MKKVLVVATSRATRGGITSIIRDYESTFIWSKWHCFWIETHIDRSLFKKACYFIKSLFLFAVKVRRYDLIHVHLSEPVSAIRKTIFVLVAKILQKKVILHLNAFSPITTFKDNRFLYSWLFSKADSIVLVSEQWRVWLNDYIQGFDHKVTVIYNPSKLVVNNNSIPKKNIILYAGTLNKRKGYSDLLKAFSLISKEHPTWKLSFAGNGEIDKATSLAKTLDVLDRVIFHGWIDGQRKSDAFLEATIFCLPSYAEGFPLAVLDAMAYGLPIITTPVGGILDILEHEKNSMIFTPGDVETLAVLLDQLITNEELRSSLSNESRKLNETIFSSHTIASQVDSLYCLLLN